MWVEFELCAGINDKPRKDVMKVDKTVGLMGGMVSDGAIGRWDLTLLWVEFELGTGINDKPAKDVVRVSKMGG